MDMCIYMYVCMYVCVGGKRWGGGVTKLTNMYI